MRTARFEAKCYVCLLVGRVRIAMRFRADEPHRLEIGSGESRKPGFITSDLNLHSDYPCDFTAGLPFPDGSIDLIYAEHVFEHFSYSELTALVRECRRILRPGGVISVSVPDPRIYVNAYARGEPLDLARYAKYKFGLTFSSPMDYLNHIFYMDGQHKYMFEPQSLQSLFADAGFTKVWLRDFDPDLDQEARRHMSLYVAAEK